MAMLIYEGKQTEVEGECTLGRHRDCGLVVSDGGASRKNTRVFLAEGCWWVEDLKSANGTRHNGTKLEGKTRLRNGDSIRIGESEVAFFCSERESTAAQRIDPQSLEGREVAGYRVGQLLGRSGLGFMYRAQQISLQRQVAFKVFARKVVEEDPQFAGKFRELVAKSGKIEHDSFVKMHENGEEDGLTWYSMELVQGDTLAHLLAREGKFQPELALLVCERIAVAMSAAHKAGVIHRDLAPRTVMLTAEGTVKILDLGIASVLGRWRDRARPEAAWHSAPEVATKSEPQPADDAYSLGCMMYHLLVGQRPFTGGSAEQVFKAHAQEMIPSLQAHVPLIGTKANELFQTLAAKNPEWRSHNMTEIAASLRELREGMAQSAVSAQNQAKKMLVRAQASKQRSDAKTLRNVIVLTVIALVGLIVWVLQSPQIPTNTIAQAAEPVTPTDVESVVRPIAPISV
ncbi:MAG: FHA domain-containing serine/threonine-protein kinase, partial [Planctomycetota bacterium]